MTDDLCVLGVDPGLTGAIGFYFPARPELISAEDMPTVGKVVDAATLARRIAAMAPALAVMELVSARPGQGVSSMFNFGHAAGTVRGVLAALQIPTRLVTPGVWKRHWRLDADKERARALALLMWPASSHFSRKMDHGRAEAALVARYGAEVLLGRDGAA